MTLVAADAALHVRIHTDVLGTSCITRTPRHQVPAVLQVPARSADVGAGDHDCRGERGPTHGAHGVFVLVGIAGCILDAIQKCPELLLVIGEDGRERQAQVVGGCPAVSAVGPAHDPRVDELRGSAALRTAPANEGGALGVLDKIR